MIKAIELYDLARSENMEVGEALNYAVMMTGVTHYSLTQWILSRGRG